MSEYYNYDPVHSSAQQQQHQLPIPPAAFDFSPPPPQPLLPIPRYHHAASIPPPSPTQMKPKQTRRRKPVAVPAAPPPPPSDDDIQPEYSSSSNASGSNYSPAHDSVHSNNININNTNTEEDHSHSSSPSLPLAPTTNISSCSSTAPRHVQIKTKFPVARIKRIMQADEDVGKVAQVTPVVVSKALELFMIALCDKASEQARQRNSKRITAGHLKQAILHEEQFDFLADIIEKIPDIPLPAEGGSLSNPGGDSEDGTAPVKKTRKPRTRKVKDEDAF